MRAAEKDPAEQEELGTQRERECVEEEPRIDMTPGAEINVQDQNGYLLLRLNRYNLIFCETDAWCIKRPLWNYRYGHLLCDPFLLILSGLSLETTEDISNKGNIILRTGGIASEEAEKYSRS